MKLSKWMLVGWLAIGFGLAQNADAGTTAVCPVCRVKEGATEEEPVKAVRTHQGREYGFCSEKCASEFMTDPAAYVLPEFPRAAPAWALTSLDGRKLTSEGARGKVVLLDFWATWCVPCRKSMPELQALHTKYAERGFSVIGISIDENAAAKVKKFVASKKFTYPIAIDSGKNPAWDAYRVKAIPAAFLIDQKGRIVAQWTGVPASTKELEETLERLLAAD
jgi:peroxiredoxin/YHS domain-containing protein